MSWIRSAVNRAVEVGGRNNLSRAVLGYADSVVQQAGCAVSEGARFFKDRVGGRNIQSLKHTVKRLEEISVSCRGLERIQLLRRWLVALKDIERMCPVHTNDQMNLQLNHTSDESKDSLGKPILYYDNDIGGEPMNFRDVFLLSEAVEGITLSMILEVPNEEEVSLLLEIFRLCLTGGKEVHDAILSGIKELTKAFSTYQDEVLVKREELLEFAQSAIAGLKINANLSRIDAEAFSLKKTLDDMKETPHSLGGDHKRSSLKSTLSAFEDLKEAFKHIQMCTRLEVLLLKKKSLNNGDSPETHAQKQWKECLALTGRHLSEAPGVVIRSDLFHEISLALNAVEECLNSGSFHGNVDKLKVLSESLAGSTRKAEKRIEDHRSEKEDALNFRVAKASEVGQLEKELAIEIGGLQKQRDELEAELKKVNSSLTTALAHFNNVKEEREQFDEANSQIVALLKTKEDELSKSIASFRLEADVVNTWIKFLEETWVLQSSYTEQKEKQVNEELQTYQEYFINLVISLLSSYKVGLESSVSSLRRLVENLNSMDGNAPGVDAENPNRLNPKKYLEEQYLDFEAKFITTFSIVDSMKKHFYDQREDILRKDDERVSELFDAIDKIKDEFESIERPVLDIETPRKSAPSAVKQVPQKSLFVPKEMDEAMSTVQDVLDTDAELAKLESEVGNDGRVSSSDEIHEWIFDALEEDVRTSDSSQKV